MSAEFPNTEHSGVPGGVAVFACVRREDSGFEGRRARPLAGTLGTLERHSAGRQ
eukprot:COSAG02_NODE_42249_length_386_cov_0.724739_1_plen_53_part_10